MQTINCLRIRMVKCLPGILVLTAGMGHLWRKSGCRTGVWWIFLWMSSWHHKWRRQTPDHRLHTVQRLLTDRGLTWVALTQMFCRETIPRPMNMSAVHQTAMFIRPRTILLILMSTIVRLQDFLLGLQSHSSQTLHLELLLLSHPWRCGWLRKLNSLLQGKVSSRKQKSSDAIAGDLNIL